MVTPGTAWEGIQVLNQSRYQADSNRRCVANHTPQHKNLTTCYLSAYNKRNLFFFPSKLTLHKLVFA